MNIKIYQIKRIEDLQIKFLFTSIDLLKNGVSDVNINNYDLVYDNDVELKSDAIPSMLEEIFRIFNVNHPEDFKGHSLSVSDIVEIDNKRYFCDNYGWVKLDDNDDENDIENCFENNNGVDYNDWLIEQALNNI